MLRTVDNIRSRLNGQVKRAALSSGRRFAAGRRAAGKRCASAFLYLAPAKIC
jgi:hypothetical protein